MDCGLPGSSLYGIFQARVLEWIAISSCEMQGLDEAQVGITSGRRNISNLRYADDTTLMAESKEELKSLLVNMKEEREKADLKLSIQTLKIITSGPTLSWQIDGNNRNSDRLFCWAPKSLQVVIIALKLKDTCSLEEKQ